MQYSSDCGIAFKLPALVVDLSFLFFLLFVSWPTSVLRAIPYYTALHCHNPYITYRSNDSAFMVQCAHRLPREFQRISWKKSISGTHLGSRVALCRLCAQIDSFSLWNLFEITYKPIAWKISKSSKHTFLANIKVIITVHM